MKFNIYKSVAACSLLAMLAGCHDFEEMNTNPYQPVYDPSIIGGTADGIDIDYTVSDNALESLRATEGSAGATFLISFTKVCITITKQQPILPMISMRVIGEIMLADL